MKRRLVNGLEQDAIKARHLYAFTENNPAIVAWVKRQIHKRERREGRCEARGGGRVTACPTPGKRGYPTRVDALIALDSTQRKRTSSREETRAYHCPCGRVAPDEQGQGDGMKITERCGCGSEFNWEDHGPYAASWGEHAVAEWRDGHRHDVPPAMGQDIEPPPPGTTSSQVELSEPVFGFSGSDTVICRRPT